jgi:Xaa-Pro dipeptidase
VARAAKPRTSRPGRVQRLQQHLQDNGIDLALVSGEGNVAHQSGYQRYYQGLAMVVVPDEGEPALIVTRFEVPAAKEIAFTKTIVGYGEPSFGLDLDAEKALASVLPGVVKEVLRGRVPKIVGLAGASQRAADALKALGAKARSVVLDPVLSTIREVKDRDEIAAVTHSYQLCLRAQEAVAKGARAGTTEIELFSLAQRVAQVADGVPVFFGGDFQGGPHSFEVCSPVRVPGTRPLERGDVLVADILVGARGYWGDTARTHSAGAMPKEKAQQLAELENIKKQAAERLRPGARGADLFAWAKKTIEGTFKGGEFPHHLGHAVGVTVFEDPHLIPADRRELREGMLIAVEPGVYFPGRYGLRTEDIYEVTAKGGRQLQTG